MPRLVVALAAAVALEVVLLIVWWSDAENYDCASECTTSVFDVVTYAVVPAVILALVAVTIYRRRRA